MQMFFVVVLAILTVISWYGFIRCMVNPNWLRQKGERGGGPPPRRYYAIKLLPLALIATAVLISEALTIWH